MSDAVISRRGNINSSNNSATSTSVYAILRVNTYSNIKVTCVNEDKSKSYSYTSNSNGLVEFHVGYGYWTISCEYKTSSFSISQYVDVLQIYNLYLPERHTYGIEINQTTGECVYTDDAIGFEAVSYNDDGTFNYGSWEDIVHNFIGCRPCLLNVDTETGEERITYLNPNNYTKSIDGEDVDITSGNEGDVMVEFAPLWYKFSSPNSDDDVLSFQISNYDRSSKELGGFTLGCFGNIMQPMYYGSYAGTSYNNAARSISGQMVTFYDSEYDKETLFKYASTNGHGYRFENWVLRSYILGLLILLAKHKHIQYVFGGGHCEAHKTIYDTSADSGLFDNMGLFGKIANINNTDNEINNSVGIKCLGIEHFWGNMDSLCDGIYVSTSSSSYNLHILNNNNEVIGISPTHICGDFGIYKLVATADGSSIVPYGNAYNYDNITVHDAIIIKNTLPHQMVVGGSFCFRDDDIAYTDDEITEDRTGPFYISDRYHYNKAGIRLVYSKTYANLCEL